MIEWAIFFVVWIICGVFAYGIVLAQFQKGFPLSAKEAYRADVCFASVWALAGIIGLFFCLLDWKGVRQHGLLYRRPKEKKVDYSFPKGKPDWEI